MLNKYNSLILFKINYLKITNAYGIKHLLKTINEILKKTIQKSFIKYLFIMQINIINI